MAGIYIPNVHIPQYGCRISILSDGCAYYENMTEPYQNLGKVIIVNDHGRLGDLDELAQSMRNRKNYIGQLSDPDCLVADAPTIIPADVVRCKDCAEWQTGWTPSSAPKGTHYCPIVGFMTDPNWFCKDGNKSEVDNG